MPQQTVSGMNIEEFRNVSAAVSDLADPSNSNKRAAGEKYTVYTDEDRASVHTKLVMRELGGSFLTNTPSLQKVLFVI